jgi:non-heme chloroperoxidase
MPLFRARDGAALHYLDVGRGPACVMLHAFGMRAAMWLPYVLPFAAHRRFLLLDFRGFGGSRGARPSQADALVQNADDVEDLMQALALDRVRLAVFSIGAATGLAYQRRYGFGRVASYLHVDQAPCIANARDWRWGLLGRGNARAFTHARELLAAFAGIEPERPFRALPADLQRQFWTWFGEFFDACIGRPWWKLAYRVAGRQPGRLLLAPDDWAIYVHAVRSFVEQDYDFRASLRRVGVPVWVVIGADSGVYPAEGQRRIARYVPDTRIVELSGCGHLVPVEAPARFVLTLGRFLAAPS